jgi:hypothetical protein
MSTQAFPAAAKSLIETSRNAVVSAIDEGRQSAHRTLGTCDKLFKAGTDTLAQVPVAITTELRDNVVALECQVNLIASLVAQGVAHQTTEVTNLIAGTASSAADNFEQVFDTRVMQALNRLGVPASVALREIADRVAVLVAAIDRLLQVVQTASAAPVAQRKSPNVAKRRPAKARPAGKRASRRAA